MNEIERLNNEISKLKEEIKMLRTDSWLRQELDSLKMQDDHIIDIIKKTVNRQFTDQLYKGKS